MLALLTLAGCVAWGLVVTVRDLGASDARGDESPEPTHAETIRTAYAEAVLRFGLAGAFAFRGSIHSTGPNLLRPGAWIASDVTVGGAVLLPRSLTREVAVDAGGGAVETVTSGPSVWSRRASNPARLAAAPWRVVDPPDAASPGVDVPRTAVPGRLGIALVADALRSAGDRREAPPDAAGRPRFRATMPSTLDDGGVRDLLAGADVLLTVDDGGDVARIVLSSGPGDGPQLVVELDIVRLGDRNVIPPAVVGIPARRTVRTEVLEAANIAALELGELPPGWALTDARAIPDESDRRWGTPACPGLALEYVNLWEVADGRMSLWVTSAACRDELGGRGSGEPFSVGTFSGAVAEVGGDTYGTVSDGVTSVSFRTDLSATDAGGLLASLVPFDAAPEPPRPPSTG